MILIYIWAIFNIFISIYEIYVFKNNEKLELSTYKYKNDILINGWSEYSRVDPRYIISKYVWNFELLNVLLTVLLLVFLIFFTGSNKMTLINSVLLLQIYSTSLYFITLINDYKNDVNVRNNIIKNSSIEKRIIYYLISLIWIIVPFILLSMQY
jgi:hypothetical protein